MATLYIVLNSIIQVLILILIVDSILSFFPSPSVMRVRMYLGMVLNPILNPIRRLIPMNGPLDFSPMVLILILYMAQMLLRNLLF